MSAAQRATTDSVLHSKRGWSREKNATRDVDEILRATSRRGVITEPLLVTWMYANQGRVPPYDGPLVRCYLNQTDDVGRTALHYFASGLTNDEGDYYDDGHVAYFAIWFCVVGAELDATDDAGKTPLHYLVDRLFEFPDPDVAEALTVLLDAGASLNVVDAHGLTPYARAAIYGDVETLRIMERSNYGIDLDIVCARDLPTEEIPGTREPLVQSEHENLRKPIKGKTVGKLREEVGV